ncbi:hypothetical protein AB0N14_38380 [Streptomyces sp. NPDC051104]|uniref:hypothetical protein n=1 Tax=Streptomyces sp. NPDC051104 TaxID=3155044 RepID=UPI0034234F99
MDVRILVDVTVVVSVVPALAITPRVLARPSGLLAGAAGPGGNPTSRVEYDCHRTCAEQGVCGSDAYVTQ